MAKEKPLKIECYNDNPNILLINGEKYVLDRNTRKRIDGVEHGNRMVFKKLNETELEKDKQTIIKILSKKTTSEEIITETMKLLDAGTIRKMAKRIRQKKPIRKQRGCLGFKNNLIGREP